MPKKFDPEVKDRAVRMVLDRVEEAGSVTKAVALVSPKVDVGRETLRRWVCQHRVDCRDASKTSHDTRRTFRRTSWIWPVRKEPDLPPSTQPIAPIGTPRSGLTERGRPRVRSQEVRSEVRASIPMTKARMTYTADAT